MLHIQKQKTHILTPLGSFVDFEKTNHKLFRGSCNEHSYQLAKLFWKRLRSIRFTDDDQRKVMAITRLTLGQVSGELK